MQLRRARLQDPGKLRRCQDLLGPLGETAGQKPYRGGGIWHVYLVRWRPRGTDRSLEETTNQDSSGHPRTQSQSPKESLSQGSLTGPHMALYGEARGRRVTTPKELPDSSFGVVTPLPPCCARKEGRYSPVLLWGEPLGSPSPICTCTQLPRGGPRGGGRGSWGPGCFSSSVSVLEVVVEKQP